MASLAASRADSTPRDRTAWMGSLLPIDSAKSSIALPRPYQTGRHMVDETAAGTLYMRDGDGLQSPEQYAPVGAEVARRLRPGGGGFEGLNVQGDDSNGKNGHQQMMIVDVQPQSFHPEEPIGQRRTDPVKGLDSIRTCHEAALKVTAREAEPIGRVVKMGWRRLAA